MSPIPDQQHQAQLFSAQLEAWLAHQPKTLLSLNALFSEKAFAVAFILLLSLSAMPLPTGGLTHVLEIVAMLLALELVLGRTSIWLPRRWRSKQLGPILGERGVPPLLTLVKFLERFSRPRSRVLLKDGRATRIFGLIVFGFSFSAFASPPFSGLDTLPALGVVITSLGVIFGDIIIVGLGFGIGCIGIGLEFAIGVGIYKFVFKRWA